MPEPRPSLHHSVVKLLGTKWSQISIVAAFIAFAAVVYARHNILKREKNNLKENYSKRCKFKVSIVLIWYNSSSKQV